MTKLFTKDKSCPRPTQGGRRPKAERNLILFFEPRFETILMANSIQVDALCQLLIEKGIITEQEFFTKLKHVQAEYQERKVQT